MTRKSSYADKVINGLILVQPKEQRFCTFYDSTKLSVKQTFSINMDKRIKN